MAWGDQDRIDRENEEIERHRVSKENEVIGVLMQIVSTAEVLARQGGELMGEGLGDQLANMEDYFLYDTLEDAKEVRTFLSRLYSLFDALHESINQF